MLELQNRHIWQIIHNSDVDSNFYFTQDRERQENCIIISEQIKKEINFNLSQNKPPQKVD